MIGVHDGAHKVGLHGCANIWVGMYTTREEYGPVCHQYLGP